MAETHWNAGPPSVPPPPAPMPPAPTQSPTPPVAPMPPTPPVPPTPANTSSTAASWAVVLLGAVGAGLAAAVLALGVSWWLPLGDANSSGQETTATSTATTQPAAGPEEAEDGEEELTIVPEPEPEVPLGYADLANATLELPEDCVEWIFGEGAPTTHTLVGGEVTGLPSESVLFELREAQPMDVDGKAFTVATFGCHIGSSPSMAPWAIYDVDGNLVEAHNAGSFEGVQGLTPAKYIENLRVQGQSFSYDFPSIMLADDAWCGTCYGSGSATVTWDFDGSEARLAEILYHLPTGDTTTPDPAAFGSMS